MKSNWFHAGMAALLAASCLAMGCSKGGKGGEKATALTFQNPNSADLNLILAGGFDGQFWVQAGESVTIATRPGESTTIRIQMDPAPESSPEATVDPVGGRKASPAPIDASPFPCEPIDRPAPACLRFINQGPAPVLVEAPWKFEVIPGSPISRAVDAGSEVEIVYRAVWNEGDYEEPSPKKIKAPAAGRTNDVVLTLVSKKNMEFTLPANVEFSHSLPETVRVRLFGPKDKELTEFDIRPGEKTVKYCNPGETLKYEYWTPYSTDYNRGTNTVTALPGGTTKYEIITPTCVAAQSGAAILTLVNPNDVDIMVDLSGGASGFRKVMKGGVPLEIPIEAGKDTVVRYFTADPRYREYGRANAGSTTVSGSTNLSLVLHPKPAPTLTVRNDGPVPLVVALTGAKSGRRDGPAAIPPQQSAVFRNLPAGEELNLKYTPDGTPHYRGGSKRLFGLEWGETSSETVRAVLQNQPAMEICNTGYRAVKVTVTRNGTLVADLVTRDNTPVENPFRLEGKDSRILTFDEAGEYRVQTEAVIGANDPFGGKGDYNATDRMVACDWGDAPTLVECDANVTKGHPDMPPVTDQDSYIQGALKDASINLSKPWGAHGQETTIGKIVNWLSAAKRYGTGEDVDGLVENVPGVLAYEDWKRAVENKQNSAVEEKNQTILGDERWQHIVDTTQRSSSWKEFLANY